MEKSQLQLQREMGLAPFIQTKHSKMNVVIVRENVEDLYTGIEFQEKESTERVGTKEFAIGKFLGAKPEKLKPSSIKALRDHYSPHSKAPQQPGSYGLAEGQQFRARYTLKQKRSTAKA